MKIDGNTPVTLTLNLEMVQVVLQSLGSQPYDRVAGLITILQQQTARQIEAIQAQINEENNGGTAPANPEGSSASDTATAE